MKTTFHNCYLMKYFVMFKNHVWVGQVYKFKLDRSQQVVENIKSSRLVFS